MKKNNQGFAPIIILILLVLIAGGAYYFGTLKNKIIPVASVQPSSSPLVKPTADPTANWKAYTSSDGRFSFKYPNDNDWKLNVTTSSLAASADVICQTCTNQNIESFGVVPVNFKTLAEFSGYKANLLDKIATKLGNIDAIQSIQPGSVQAPTCRITFVLFNGQGYELIECFKDTRISTITKSSELPPANPNILSTFKFTK